MEYIMPRDNITVLDSHFNENSNLTGML